MKTMKLLSIVVGLAALTAASSAFAAGDPAAGEKVFAKCKICHQVGETAKNATGPQLNGLIGRKAGTVEGYTYTEANKNSGLTWDDATLQKYLANPKAVIPGTKMTFAGLPNETDIKDVISYLSQFSADGKKK